MKKIKSFIIYGVIILLCAAAFGGYLVSKLSNPGGADTAVNSQAAQSTVASSGTAKSGGTVVTAGAAGTVPAKSGTTPAKSADKGAELLAQKLITDGSNITGKSEEERQNHVKEVMKRATGKLDPNPVVGIGRGEDFATVTREAVTNAGGLKDIIKQGDFVLIKPNICDQTQKDGSWIITDHRVVQEVINLAKECGASRIVVAEGNFGSNAFANTKNKYVELEGAQLFNFNDVEEKDCYELKPQKSLVGKPLFIPKIYMDADVVIDVAKLKTHFITKVTLGLKNSIGVPSFKIYGVGGDKSGLHMLGIEEAIIDLNKIRKPDFTVIDGINAGEGFGPVACTPVKANIVFAGRDVVATDTAALTFMGYTLEDVSHVKLAAKEKLGIADLKKIKVVGADLNSIKMKFKP